MQWFDFSHNRCWLTNYDESIPLQSLRAIESKTLEYQSSGDRPLDIMARVGKFSMRGYTITHKEIVKILQDIVKLPKGEQEVQLSKVAITSSGELL